MSDKIAGKRAVLSTGSSVFLARHYDAIDGQGWLIQGTRKNDGKPDEKTMHVKVEGDSISTSIAFTDEAMGALINLYISFLTDDGPDYPVSTEGKNKPTKGVNDENPPEEK